MPVLDRLRSDCDNLKRQGVTVLDAPFVRDTAVLRRGDYEAGAQLTRLLRDT
jgi:hypothetical protein